MKNISVVLNVVLFIAVAVLYYLHFQTSSPAKDTTSAAAIMPLSSNGIVYVNSDSLLEEYDFYKQKKNAFEEKQDKIKAELKSEGDKLQREVELYQQQAIGMTDKERSEKEEQLGIKQQRIMQRKDQLLSELDEEQGKSSDELYVRLNSFLKKYNEGKNYSYVLGFQKGGGILYANDTLNITRDVIKGLNDEFRNENIK